MTAADVETGALKHLGEPPRTEERILQMQLVDGSHERQIGRRNRLGLLVETRAAQIEQFALVSRGLTENQLN